MRIFLTGGSGFLGKRVIEKLVKENHRVYGLARSQASSEIVEKMGANPIEGDLNNISSFEKSLAEIDIVIHCAAPVEFWGPWKKYQQGIIESTKMLAEASNKHGVKRFIHISSESVLQDKEALLDIDESYEYAITPNSYYGQAKKVAEKNLLESNYTMEVLIIRPTFIWGKGSNALETISSKMMSGAFVWVNNGSADFEAVHVDNVAEAIWLALTKGKNRGVYFITDNEATDVKNFFSGIFENTGPPMPKISIPSFIANAMVCVFESVWKMGNIKSPPPISRFDLAFVNMPRRYNINKAVSELGYKPIVSRSIGFKSLS